MKLNDLRKMYEAPKHEKDDLDSEDGPVERVQVAYGVDLALGPDWNVCSYRCVKCGLVNQFAVPHSLPVFVPLCLQCDACAVCHGVHDKNNAPLTLCDAHSIDVRMAPDEPVELIERQFRVCEACFDTVEARKRGIVRKLS